MTFLRSSLRGLANAAPLALVFCLAVGTDHAQTDQPATPVVAPPSPAFPALPNLLADYRGLHAGPAYDAAGKELHVGHLRLLFTSGALTSILTATGREAGFVFEGSGRYDYTSEDAGDLQALGKNIAKLASTSSYKDGTLGEEMKGCVLVSTQPILDETLGVERKPSSGGAGATARLTSFLADADAADIGVDHPGALAALSPVRERMVYAEIDGRSVDPGFVYDPVSLREEQLRLFRSIQGDRFYNVVSRQRIGDGWTASPFVMTRLDYTLDTANNHDATLRIAETFQFPMAAQRLLRFLFINNAATAATNWKSSKYNVDIRSIKTADGRELPFSHRYHELLVELPEPPAAGSTQTLVFDVAFHSLDTRGDEFVIVTASNGYPIPAWRNAIRATSHWKVRTKKPYKAFTGGNGLARSEEGASLFLESEVDVPTDLPVMIAGKFDTKEYDRNGVKLRVNIYGTAGGRAFETYREAGFTLLGVYGNALVPYPRKELDIMELKKTYVSVSMPGHVLVSGAYAGGGMVDSATHAHADDFDGAGRGSGIGASVIESLKGDRQLRTFMHELAHQWFGNLVHPDDLAEDRWISESVAEYLSALVYAAGAKDEKDKAQKMNEAVKGWWADTDMSRNSVSIARAADLRGGWTEDEAYVQLLYGRGPLVLRMLHGLMGEDKFFAVLHNVVTKYADKEVSTADFAKETTAVAGQAMAWFFKQWFQEPGVPELDVTHTIAHEAGRTYITGHLKQRDPARFKILVLPFVYQTKGTQAAKLVLMDKPDMDFKAEIAQDASNVLLDPGRGVLAYYR